MNKDGIKRTTAHLKNFLILFKSFSFNTRNQKIILMYHGISKRPMFNCITQDLFRQQLSWIKDKYTVVPLSELVDNLETYKKEKSNLLSITFDDGYTNFAEYAVPVLAEYRCHATVFVSAGKVGGYNDWDVRTNGFRKLAIMSYSQLVELPKSIVEIGSHGFSHIPLNNLPIDMIAKEIIDSRVEIEQRIGKKIHYFAFPFGAYPTGIIFNSDKNLVKMLSSYSAACSSRWGRFNSKRDIYALRRIGIWDSDNLEDFLDKMNGHYDWIVVKEKIAQVYKYLKGC